MLNINPLKDDKDRIDLDELQYSFVAYTKYYELIAARVADLLEKIKLAVCKRVGLPDQVDTLCEAILDASTDSKIQPKELRKIMEDDYGVVLRESIYDQLASYFDLDRSGQVYIASLVQYLQDHTLSNFNFFKVNPNVITAHITDYVRNCISSRAEIQLEQIEQAFIEEIGVLHRSKTETKRDKIDSTKEGVLLQERINARVFQSKLKKQGIALSLWEIFTLFEYLNTTVSKQVFYEPQRYHAILFSDFYTLITGKDDYRENLTARLKERDKKQGKKTGTAKKATEVAHDDALQLAAELN